MKGVCYIIGASNAEDIYIDTSQKHYIIAADGGYSYLEAQGIKADLLVGDFDSLDGIPKHENIIRHQPEKDDTDLLLAVKEGLSLGYRIFVIYGGLGGRLDHTYGNLQVLAYIAEQGGRGYLIGEEKATTVETVAGNTTAGNTTAGNTTDETIDETIDETTDETTDEITDEITDKTTATIMTAVKDGMISFHENHFGIISVFSATSYAKGVDLKGLKYELTDAVLTNTLPLGVSNEFIGVPSTVSVKDGTLIVMWNCDVQDAVNHFLM